LALAYVVGTPPETVQRDMQNIGYAIDRFGRNFKNNANTISDSITHLTAKKKDDIGFIEDLLRKHGILDRATRRKLHDEEITRKGLSEEEIEAEIAEMARRLKNKNKDKDKNSKNKPK
jgi:hypothetical protein